MATCVGLHDNDAAMFLLCASHNTRRWLSLPNVYDEVKANWLQDYACDPNMNRTVSDPYDLSYTFCGMHVAGNS